MLIQWLYLQRNIAYSYVDGEEERKCDQHQMVFCAEVTEFNGSHSKHDEAAERGS